MIDTCGPGGRGVALGRPAARSGYFIALTFSSMPFGHAFASSEAR